MDMENVIEKEEVAEQVAANPETAQEQADAEVAADAMPEGAAGEKQVAKDKVEAEHEEHVVAKRIRRGDIFYADLGEARGSVQSGVRPVLIVQNDAGNHYSKTTIVVVLTTKVKKMGMPTHILLPPQDSGLRRMSVALCEQLLTIDKSCLDPERTGWVSAETMDKIDTALLISVGLHEDYRSELKPTRTAR